MPQLAEPIPALSVSRVIAWLCVSAYLVIGLGMAWLSRFEMTPDGFAYVQIARHYANGSFPLAVNSWWGPLLPWLLVPFIWMKMHPIFAARLLSIVFGLGFAVGVSALVRGMTGGRGWLIALVMGLLASLTMLPRYLSPDMLAACLITWYFAKTMKLLRSDSIGLAAAIGLLGGLAYLAKAYALPFVLFHLAGTVFFKSLLAGRSVTKASLKQYAAAIAVLLLVAAPWILVISIHDGRPTLGSAAKYASAWSGNESLGGMPFTRLQLPREGRIWSWEDPAETRFPWPTWSALDGIEGLKKQIRVTGANIVSLPELLNTADAFQLMSGGFILVLVFLFPLRRTSFSSRSTPLERIISLATDIRAGRRPRSIVWRALESCSRTRMHRFRSRIPVTPRCSRPVITTFGIMGCPYPRTFPPLWRSFMGRAGIAPHS